MKASSLNSLIISSLKSSSFTLSGSFSLCFRPGVNAVLCEFEPFENPNEPEPNADDVDWPNVETLLVFCWPNGELFVVL